MIKTVVRLLLFVSLNIFYFCSSKSSFDQTDASDLTSDIPPTEVTISIARTRPFDYFIPTSGKIFSSREVPLQFRRNGLIENLYAKTGDLVNQGDLLAALENAKQEIALARSKLSVEEKMFDFQDLLLSYRSSKDTLTNEAAIKNIRISSGLAAAELAFEEAKLEYNNSFIRAPFSGVVAGVNLSEGSPVRDGDELCYVHDPKSLVVKCGVLEGDALILKRGIRAQVTPISMPEAKYSAEVEIVNPRVNNPSGMVDVVLRLDGNPMMFPGMNVQVIFQISYDENLIVPKEAVVIRSGKHVIFTVENSLAKWNYVAIGRENGREVEILSGLQPGDSVITRNNLQLSHDAMISIVGSKN